MATFTGTAGNDAYNGTAGDDSIDGQAGNDTLVGGAGNDSILGGNGDDLLDGGTGSDTVDGGDGTDTVALSFARQTYTVLDLGGGSFRVLAPSVGVNVLVHGIENLGFGDGTRSLSALFAAPAQTLLGSDGSDTLVGSEQGDRIEGRGGPDRLVGNGGDDLLISGSTGNGDNDELLGGPGNDTLDGTGGLAAASYRTSPIGVNVDLAAGSGSDGFGTTDTCIAIAGVEGSAFDDTLRGDAGFNYFVGGGGNDLLDGRAGFDWASYDDQAQPIVANLALGTAGNATVGNDTLVGIEALSGGEAGDTLVGSGDANQLRGNGGNDLLQGGDGDDSLEAHAGNDTIEGGAGSDWVLYEEAPGGVSVQLGAGTASGAAGNDTLSSIENVRGSAFNDTLFGNFADNWIEGGAGADQLNGGAGNDTLDGGVVLDRLLYNDNTRLTYLGDPVGVRVDLSGITGDGSTGFGTAQDGYGGQDVLKNITTVIGSAHADTIAGSAARTFEAIDGGAGDDVLDGGAIDPAPYFIGVTNNRVMFSQVSASVVVDLAAGTAQGHGNDQLSRFNIIRATLLADTLRGSDRTDIVEQFEASGGNDSIDGRGGFDILRFDGGTGGVVASLVTGTAQDGQGGTDLFTGIEGLRGGSNADSLSGGLAANGTTALGRVASDRLERFIGMGGADTLDGGQGFDRAEYMFANSGIVVVFNDNGTGTAQDGTGSTDTLRDIEAIVGSVYGDMLTGSGRPYEWFAGLKGADTIAGGGGVDEISFLHDELQGAVVDLAQGTAVDGWGDTDVISGIEWVEGTWAFGDTITGDSGANRLDGVGGNDSLIGGDGDDTLVGGSGIDTLQGGAGNDLALLPFPRAQYTLTSIAGGLRLSHAGSDRVDATAVESFQFSDATFSLAQLQAGGNRPPVFNGTTFGISALEDTPTTYTQAQLLAGFSDPDGDLLTITLPGFAGLVANNDGSYTFTPPANASFTTFSAGLATVSDGRGGTWQQQMRFTVTPVNDAPQQLPVFDGVQALHLSGRDYATGAITLPDDSLLVGGSTSRAGGQTGFALVHLAADGTRNLAFAGDGLADHYIGSANVSSVRLVRQSDGKVLMAAQLSGSGANLRDFAVTRFNADGSLDSSFAGGAGHAVIDLANNDTMRGLAVASDGKIVMVGYGRPGSATSDQALIVQLNPDGTLDTSFSGDGWTAIDLSVNQAERLEGVAVQDDGKIVAVGRAVIAGITQGIALRLNTDGSLDTGFNGNGISTAVDPSLSSISGRAVRINGDGSIYVAGTGVLAANGVSVMLLGKITAGGAFDTSYNGDGWTQAFFGSPAEAYGLLVQPDGKVVVSGDVGSAQLALARFNTDGTLDTDGASTGFSNDGKFSVAVASSSAGGVLPALQSGGQIVFVGQSFDSASGSTDFALARVNRFGILDGSFNPLPQQRGVPEDQAFSVTAADLLRGWVDVDEGDGLTIGDVSADHGSVEIASPGVFRITPAPGATGPLTLSYQVSDGHGGTAAGTRMFLLGGAIHAFTGSGGDDDLAGTNGDDTLDGLAGNDTLAGRGGADHLLGGDGNDSLDGGAGLDLADGGDGNDTLVADEQQDTLIGGAGDDRLDGVAFTNVSYAGSPAAIQVMLGGNDTQRGTVADGFGGTDSLAPVAFSLHGSAFADSMTGADAGNLSSSAVWSWDHFYGGDGNDTLRGRGGFDYLSGEAGDDSLDGGAEGDNLLGGDGNDTLAGGSGDDTLRPGSGSDLLQGGEGIDLAAYEDLPWDGVVVDLMLDTLSKPGGGSDTLVDVEGAIGSPGADRFIGDAGNNRFRGGRGNDTFEGSAGSDALDFEEFVQGGSGVVVVLPSSAEVPGTAIDLFGFTDVIRLGAAEQVYGSKHGDHITGAEASLVDGVAHGHEYVWGGGGNDTLLGLSGRDTLQGGSGDDSLSGGAGDDYLIGDDGADTLIPGSGSDTVDGGAGSDMLVLAFAQAAYQHQLAGADLLLVHSGGDRVLLRGVEHVQFSDGTASAAALLATAGASITGSAGPDTLAGGEGHDTVRGLEGDDRLAGGAGNDSLDGGIGNYDWLSGGDGNDTLDGGAASDVTYNVDIAIFEGSLPVSANLQLGTATQGTFTDTLVRIDAIFSGSGADSLRSADGDAVLRGETLRGGPGNDTLDGGSGVDAAEFVRPRSEYTVAKVNDSTWTVHDNVAGNGDEGTDTLVNIERIVFADQMLSFGTRAEELARVAFVLWNPAIVGSAALFARGLSFYDVGYDFTTMSIVALQFWTGDSDTRLAERLIANSGSTKTVAQLLATMAANGGAVEGRAAALREIALDAATTQRIEESNIRTVGLVSDHAVPGFGTLFQLLPEG